MEQQRVGRKRKGEKPINTGFSPLLVCLIMEESELRIWGLGVRISPGAPNNSIVLPGKDLALLERAGFRSDKHEL
jgi:hypothetical protein